MLLLKIIACSLVTIGLGWTFAEIRRFFIDPQAFFIEAEDDYEDGRTISLVCGGVFLLIGAFFTFHAFGLGAPALTLTYPYLAAGPETQHLLTVYGIGLGIWGVVSAASTQFLPPPLFPEAVCTFLCRIVRGGLFILLALALITSLHRIGNNWLFDGAGLLSAFLAFLAIYTGQVWSRSSSWVPAITCADRPFPFVASVLISIGLAYLCFFG